MFRSYRILVQVYVCVAPARLFTSPIKLNRTHTQVATGLVDEKAVLEVLTATELATLKQVKYAALTPPGFS